MPNKNLKFIHRMDIEVWFSSQKYITCTVLTDSRIFWTKAQNNVQQLFIDTFRTCKSTPAIIS